MLPCSVNYSHKTSQSVFYASTIRMHEANARLPLCSLQPELSSLALSHVNVNTHKANHLTSTKTEVSKPYI
jgi:hypothetical protein